MKLLNQFTNLFPLWVLLAGVVAFLAPEALLWMRGSLITIGLAVIMLGMGLTLDGEDFRRVLEHPRRVLLGVALQYLVMPFAGYAIARLFQLSPEFAVGMILVASCPGGTASNVISFLARADLGLSVSMTAVSTMLAAIMTPLLTFWLVGDRMEVSAAQLFWNTAQVVLLPVLAGVILNRYFKKLARVLQPVAPPIAVIAIALIVGAVLAHKREAVLDAGWSLLAAIFCLHLSGFALGYLLGRTTRSEQAARTIAIEVGMQNSGLGVELARTNFPDTLVDVPSAISATVHSVLGSVAAALWRGTAPSDASE
ncbi:MAG: bile acid:sodium symporter family protein [bacterium]|nr:bile acid:sodium symporter family protein [bacterium]